MYIVFLHVHRYFHHHPQENKHASLSAEKGAPSDRSPGLAWGLLQKVTPGARPGQPGNASLGCGPGKRMGRGRLEGQGAGDSQGPGRGDGRWLEGPAWPQGPGGRAPSALLIRFCLSSLLQLWGQSQIRLKNQDPGQTTCRARLAALLTSGTPDSHFRAVSPRAGGRAGRGAPFSPGAWP